MISAIPTLKIVKHLSSVGVLALILIFANSQPAYAKIFNVGRSYQEALTEYKKADLRPPSKS